MARNQRLVESEDQARRRAKQQERTTFIRDPLVSATDFILSPVVEDVAGDRMMVPTTSLMTGQAGGVLGFPGYSALDPVGAGAVVKTNVAPVGNFAVNELTTPIGALGMLSSGGKLLYNTATNIPTFLRDFYSGDPVKKIAGTAEGLFEGLKGGFLDTVMPQRRAQMEATGMGGRRAQEALNPVSDKRDKDQSIRAGNIAASGTLKAQASNTLPTEDTGTLLDVFPSYRGLTFGSTRLNDDQALVNILINDNPDLAQDIPLVQRFMNHLRHGPHRVDFDAQVAGRTRAASGSDLASEASGKAKTAAPSVRMLNSQRSMDAFYGAVGAEPSIEDWKTMISMTSGIETDVLRRLGRAAPAKRNTDAFEYFKQNKGKLPATYIQNGSPNASVIFQDYWKAIGKQRRNQKLSGPEMVLVDTINAQIASPSGLKKRIFNRMLPNNVNRMFNLTPRGKLNVNTMDDGRLVFQQSFNSSSKDLGSMNMMAVLDPETKKMYVMLSDGHDLMGMTPPGYDDFLNVLPIQVVDVGKSQKKVYPKSEATVASAARQNTADLEARSGIPRRKEETVTQYEDRVIREFKAKPTLRQRAGATYDAAALAATPQKVSGMFTEEEEERGR